MIEQPWGTLFITEKRTTCPLCRLVLPRRTLAVMTSWTTWRLLGNSVERGPAAAVHVQCASQGGVEVRWSVQRVLGDLRRAIRTIPNRRLVRK